jgi:hypothetical protein
MQNHKNTWIYPDKISFLDFSIFHFANFHDTNSSSPEENEFIFLRSWRTTMKTLIENVKAMPRSLVYVTLFVFLAGGLLSVIAFVNPIRP